MPKPFLQSASTTRTGSWGPILSLLLAHCLCLLAPTRATADDRAAPPLSPASSEPRDSLADSRWTLGGGYYSDLVVHPGAVLSVELERPRDSSLRTFFRSNVGFFVHPRNESVLFVDFQMGARSVHRSGLFGEYGVGIGVALSFYQADGIYQVNDSGEVVYAPRVANPDFMPSLAFGGGYDFEVRGGRPVMLYLRPKLFWQLPYNDMTKFRLAVELGISMPIGRGEN